MGSAPEPYLRLDFGNLPLVEAAARASFDARLPLRFEVINKVHRRLEAKFPHLSEPGRLEVAPGVSQTVELGQMPGVVYTGNSKGLTITAQGQVIVARWLKEVTGQGPEYPRYIELRGALWDAVEAFRDAFDDSAPSIVVVNLSYVNFLGVSDFGSVLQDYFSPVAQLTATSEAEAIHKVEASWRGADSIDLRFKLELVSATLPEQQKLEGYQLTTAAGLRLSEPADPTDKLDEVHGRLQRFFHDLISDRAKREWQLTTPESPNA